MLRNSVFFLFPFIISLPVFISATCYYPNGDVTPADVACSNTQSETACCGQGYACMSNGICMRNDDTVDANSQTTYVRGSCTDQTWKSSYCPNFCVDPSRDDTAGGEGMGKCTGTSLDMYYCIDSNLANVNCSTQQNVIVFHGTPTVLTTIGVAASSSSSSSSSASSSSSTPASTSASSSITSSLTSSASQIPTSTSTMTPTSQPSSKSSNHSVAIGVGVAVPIGVLAIAGIVGLLFWRRRRAKAKAKEDYTTQGQAESLPPKYGAVGEGEARSPAPPSELANTSPLGELPAQDQRHEMEGTYAPNAWSAHGFEELGNERR